MPNRVAGPAPRDSFTPATTASAKAMVTMSVRCMVPRLSAAADLLPASGRSPELLRVPAQRRRRRQRLIGEEEAEEPAPVALRPHTQAPEHVVVLPAAQHAVDHQ